MDNYDFEKEKELADLYGLKWEHGRWVADEIAIEMRRQEKELFPIGVYNGVDIPGCHILDDSYIVYIEIDSPEYDCVVL